MMKMKKILFLTIILVFSTIYSKAAIQDSLFASVGNKAITHSDIFDEIKVILILNGQTYSEDKKLQLEKSAVNSTIKRAVKQIEIAKYPSLTYNQKDVFKEANQLAENINIDLDTMKNILAANGINWTKILDNIKTELLWNSLIFQLYKDRISINKNEIEEQLKMIQNKEEVEEFLISELIIKSVPSNELNSKIDEIKKKINSEGFEKVAIDSSIAESALRGGDLGWVNENVISSNFKSAIINTPIGKISKPIIIPEGIMFFKVRDKKKVKMFTDLKEAKNKLIKAEKTKILNMHSLSHYDNLKRSVTINYY